MMYQPHRRKRRSRGRAPTALGVAGGLTMLGGGFVGLYAASTLHEWSVTYAANTTPMPALPAGVSDLQTYNSLAVVARPTWKSQAWQWGFVLVSLLAGMAAPWRPVKLASYGMAMGSALHAGWQLITGWIILPLVAGGTWGQRAYSVQLQANYTLGKMTAPTTTTASTTQGLLGQPPIRRSPPPIRALPGAQPARIPTALATAPMRAPAPVARAPFPHGTSAAPGSLGQPQGAAPSPDYTGSGTTPPPVTVPNLPNGNCPDGSTAVTNPTNLDMPFCVPNTPPAVTTPPATPPPANNTPPPPPQNNVPPPAVPACPIPWQGAPQPCCGTAPCSCGIQNGQGVPATVLGQPQIAPPLHPLFAMMLAPRRAA